MIEIQFGTFAVERIEIGLPALREVTFGVTLPVAGSKVFDYFGWPSYSYTGFVGTTYLEPDRLVCQIPTGAIERFTYLLPQIRKEWDASEINYRLGQAAALLAPFGFPHRIAISAGITALAFPVSLQPAEMNWYWLPIGSVTWLTGLQSVAAGYESAIRRTSAMRTYWLPLEYETHRWKYGTALALFQDGQELIPLTDGWLVGEISAYRPLLWDAAVYRAARIALNAHAVTRSARKPVFLRLGDYAHRLEDARAISEATRQLEEQEAAIFEEVLGYIPCHF